jgi:hypothetical protein
MTRNGAKTSKRVAGLRSLPRIKRNEMTSDATSPDFTEWLTRKASTPHVSSVCRLFNRLRHDGLREASCAWTNTRPSTTW